MNAKLNICLALMLSFNLMGVHATWNDYYTQCKFFPSADTNYVCTPASAYSISVSQYSRVCGRNPDASGINQEDKCFHGENGDCPGGWPNLVTDKSCFGCCCQCEDPLLDYEECCANSI